MTNSKLASSTYILFELAGGIYAVQSEVVQLVEMVDHITPVPNALSFVEGVVFTRGQVVPGINLRTRFGFPKIPNDIRTRMLIVQASGRTVGMLVDSAREFISISPDVIHRPSEAIAGLSGKYLKGVATVGERLILILNIEEVVNFADVSAPASEGHQEKIYG